MSFTPEERTSKKSRERRASGLEQEDPSRSFSSWNLLPILGRAGGWGRGHSKDRERIAPGRKARKEAIPADHLPVKSSPRRSSSVANRGGDEVLGRIGPVRYPGGVRRLP